jgi:predicted HNH restriction endonuclease
MTSIPKEADRLLDLIVRCIRDGRFTPGRTNSYLGYKECHDLLGLPQKGGTWGRSLQQQGLNALAEWVQDKQVPAITGLIVDTTSHKPGHGFFTAFNHGKEDFDWWRAEVRRAIAYDWSLYSSAENLPTKKEIQDFDRLYTEGQKCNFDSEVRLRCEALIKRAKAYFKEPDGELYCLVCGWHRPSKQLRGDIVEIHHLRPISALPKEGEKWTFEAAIKIFAPLCPNCHRVAHANPDKTLYSLTELKSIVKVAS